LRRDLKVGHPGRRAAVGGKAASPRSDFGPEPDPEPEELQVQGFHYTKQIRRVEILKERREFRKALTLAVECVVAAESDLEARRLGAAGSDKSGDVLGPPPPSVTWLACQLCRELGAYRLEVSLIERWLEHLDADQGQVHHTAAGQMKWRLATASEFLRTGPRPAWRQDADATSQAPSGQEGR
jgi:hypothetical protein